MAQKAAKQLEESTSRRPKRAASAAQQAIAAAAAASTADKWSADNEVLLLESFLRISEDLGVKPSYEQIHEAVQGCIPDSFSSKERVGTKLRHLKRKFLRTHAAASPPVDDLAYQLSEKIWGGEATAAGADEAEAAEPEQEADAAAASAAPKPRPKRKRKTKSTSAVLVQQPHQQDEGTAIDKDAGGARRSPRAHGDSTVPKKVKPESKSKPEPKRLQLVTTVQPSSALQLGDDSSMLSGLVRVLQQSYCEADENAVRTALENMDDRLVDEIREDWRRLQILKLEVASLSSHMARELAGALHQRARAAAGLVSDG